MKVTGTVTKVEWTNPHIAEDFKQGARTHGASIVIRDQAAPCLKFRCAKPLERPSSYVF
jgi:hypothetical protein